MKLILGGVLLSLIGTAACKTQAGSAATVDLKGYGRVTATFSAGEAKFVCQDETHADYVLGKILADLFWDKSVAQTKTTITVGGHQVPAYVSPTFGALVIFRSGSSVIAIEADDANNSASLFGPQFGSDIANAVFTPTHPYPKYLDSYDLRAVKFFDLSMRNLDSASIVDQWNFAHHFGTGMAVASAAFFKTSPADGIYEWGPTDYMLDAANRYNDMLTVSVQTEGLLPQWAYNATGSRAEPTPTTLLDAQGKVGAPSAYLQPFGDVVGRQIGLGYLDAVIKHYGANPNLGPWMIYAGEPSEELAYHDRTTMFLDYSPAGQEAFRDWLRDTRHLTPSQVGQRWWNNPNVYSDWSQIFLPDVNAFYGDPGAKSSTRLGGTWQWQSAPPGTPDSSPNGAAEPNLPDSNWVSFEAPPAQDLSLLPMGHAFYRKTFQMDAGQVERAKYLVLETYLQGPRPTSVWLNGQFVGQAVTNPTNPHFFLNVSGKVVAGENRLTIEAPFGGAGPASEGKILGPVFFSEVEPKVYPNLGQDGNARFVDLKDWQAHAMYLATASAFDQLRALDPDHPAIVSGGMYFDTGDLDSELATNFGLGLENTGREVEDNRPWDPGLGIVNGFYGTSEESSTADVPHLNQELGRMLYDGDSAHMFFGWVNDYVKLEANTQWFTQHANFLQLIGKAMRHKPPVVLLFNTRSKRYGLGTPADDVGTQGVLSRGQIDFGYASSWDVEENRLNDFPYLIDVGSVEMDKSMVEHLTQYVEQGGTFIATATTGRHGWIDANAWPISELTGFKVMGDRATGSVTFANQLVGPSSLAGSTLQVQQKNGLSLQPAGQGAQTLATWSDGSTAIGIRTLGKGRVIVIGVPGLHTVRVAGGKESGRLLMNALLFSLGVHRDTDSSDPDVWTRAFTTKNGLQEWLVAFNSSKNPATADVHLSFATQPASVTDETTGMSVPFTYQNGSIDISNVSFDPTGVHVFAVKRASLEQGLQAWWDEKVRYWNVRGTSETYVPPAPGRTDTIEITDWKATQDPQGGLLGSDAWRRAQFDDSNWSKIRTSPWASLSNNDHDYRGGMVYRGAVTIPQAWAGRRILVNLYAFDTPAIFGTAKLFFDGQPIGTYTPMSGTSQLVKFDVAQEATPGLHTLSISVEHAPNLDAISGPFISGPIWVSAGPRLTGSPLVLADWQTIGADYKPSGSMHVPGTTTAKYLATRFDAPQAWQGQTVVLALNSASRSLAIVNVNGHLLGTNMYVHAFGNATWLNLTPYLRIGQPNRIELWPQHVAMNYANNPQNQTQAIELSRVTIGAVDPQDLPLVQQ